jgi:ABC-type transport system involved in cytochrome bd biosynthesis fused ATPase/permease subunit
MNPQTIDDYLRKQFQLIRSIQNRFKTTKFIITHLPHLKPDWNRILALDRDYLIQFNKQHHEEALNKYIQKKLFSTKKK